MVNEINLIKEYLIYDLFQNEFVAYFIIIILIVDSL